MPEIKVIGWGDFDDKKYPDCSDSGKADDPYRNATIQCIRENGYKFSGNMHQNSPNGCPIFSDLTMLRGSMRYWGGIMAEAWENEPNRLSYVGWAWELPDGTVYKMPVTYPAVELMVMDSEDTEYLTLIYDEDMPDIVEFWWTKESLLDTIMLDKDIEEIKRIQKTGGHRPIRTKKDVESIGKLEYMTQVTYLVNYLADLLRATGNAVNEKKMPWLMLGDSTQDGKESP